MRRNRRCSVVRDEGGDADKLIVIQTALQKGFSAGT